VQGTDCSFHFKRSDKKIPDDSIIIRFDIGKCANLILSVADFKLPEKSNNLTFNYKILSNPYKSSYLTTKEIEESLSEVILKMITRAMEMTKLKESK